MKDNYSHICVILDASGSMSGVENATRESMNSFLEQQKKEQGETSLSIYQFDDEATIIADFENLKKMESNPMDAYKTGGCTALYDTICNAVDETGAHLAAMPEEERPKHVIVAILTDGYENASKRFSVNDVKEKITHQTDVYKWEFIFLAANQNAILTGGRMGIGPQRCMSTFTETAADMKDNADALHDAVTCCCMCLDYDMADVKERVYKRSVNKRHAKTTK